MTDPKAAWPSAAEARSSVRRHLLDRLASIRATELNRPPPELVAHDQRLEEEAIVLFAIGDLGVNEPASKV